MHRRQKAITLPRYGFDKAWVFRIVLEGSAKLLESCVQAPLEIDVRTLWPKRLTKVFPPDYFAILLKQHGKNAKWLLLNLDTDPLTV